MPRRKVATWYRDGKLFIARGPDWPRNVEYSCSDQSDLIEWAHNHKYVLRDGNVRRGNSERYSARNFG